MMARVGISNMISLKDQNIPEAHSRATVAHHARERLR